MSASLPTDERPVPMVAIIGNDAVLVAAPATPVQLAHACLRRGFTVAVPASWGDELIAAEAVRQLATRRHGPAVMCVCPYVRSRLLAPGPDLAPFLVSLLAPPVAAARYLRAVYGDRGVHVTYIGGCPGADDPAIDVRLTPDAFLADLAERGIALSEQPLVFDSIVPPDRRRWCSLPGGVPSAEMLWHEAETRTLVEIERDDASTDLAQHIITHDHILLDLAPSLGCVCSGAIASLPPRSARVAVTALEPPRAMAPIIDPAAVVPLEAPIGGAPPATAQSGTTSLWDAVVPADSATTLEPDRPAVAVPGPARSAGRVKLEATVIQATAIVEPTTEVTIESMAKSLSVSGPTIESMLQPTDESAATESAATGQSRIVPERHHVGLERNTPGSAAEPAEPARFDVTQPHGSVQPPTTAADDTRVVRHRTPSSISTRQGVASIPRAAGADGRSLPRAYVAKRRTPAAGTPRIANAPRPITIPIPGSASARGDGAPSRQTAEPESVAVTAPPALVRPSAEGPPPSPPPAVAEAPSRSAPPVRADTSHGALVFLVVAAVVALGLFVLLTLR